MKRILFISSIIIAIGITAWYFFLKEPVFKATKGFLVNLNTNGVIIEGFDAVSYFTNEKPVKGNEQYKTEYNSGIYWFASAEHAELFKKDPAKYAPQYGAFCGYAVSIGKLRPVDPAIYQIVNDRLILQHTQEAFDLFNKDLKKSVEKADMKWPDLIASHIDKPVQYDKPASVPPTAEN